MAVSQTQKVQRVAAEDSAKVWLVLLAGWLVPGAGHLLLGKWIRAALLFASIVGMYAVGLALAGKVYVPVSGDILSILGFLAQLGSGILYALTRVFGWGASSMVNTLADYGTKFLVCAGLLNLITAVDAHSLANGRKAS